MSRCCRESNASSASRAAKASTSSMSSSKTEPVADLPLAPGHDLEVGDPERPGLEVGARAGTPCCPSRGPRWSPAGRRWRRRDCRGARGCRRRAVPDARSSGPRTRPAGRSFILRENSGWMRDLTEIRPILSRGLPNGMMAGHERSPRRRRGRRRRRRPGGGHLRRPPEARTARHRPGRGRKSRRQDPRQRRRPLQRHARDRRRGRLLGRQPQRRASHPVGVPRRSRRSPSSRRSAWRSTWRIGEAVPGFQQRETVLDALLAEARRLDIDLRSAHRITAVARRDDLFHLASPGGELTARKTVLATGGLSLPKTGSDGLGYRLATSLGHSLVTTTPGLEPLLLEGDFHAGLSGIAHPVQICVRVDGRKPALLEGPMLWTHFGISGPAALDASRHWQRARLEGSAVKVTANFLPGNDFPALEATLLQLARSQPRTQLRNTLVDPPSRKGCRRGSRPAEAPRRNDHGQPVAGGPPHPRPGASGVAAPRRRRTRLQLRRGHRRRRAAGGSRSVDLGIAPVLGALLHRGNPGRRRPPRADSTSSGPGRARGSSPRPWRAHDRLPMDGERLRPLRRGGARRTGSRRPRGESRPGMR